MLLWLTRPVDDVECSECLKWTRGKDREFIERPSGSGKRVPLPTTAGLPCVGCAKIPKGVTPHPANAVNPTARSRRAYQHYQESRAVNWQTPDSTDPLVRFNAAAIRRVEEAVEAARSAGLAGLLAARGK